MLSLSATVEMHTIKKADGVMVSYYTTLQRLKGFCNNGAQSIVPFRPDTREKFLKARMKLTKELEHYALIANSAVKLPR
jgi:hypothetical protein